MRPQQCTNLSYKGLEDNIPFGTEDRKPVQHGKNLRSLTRCAASWVYQDDAAVKTNEKTRPLLDAILLAAMTPSLSTYACLKAGSFKGDETKGCGIGDGFTQVTSVLRTLLLTEETTRTTVQEYLDFSVIPLPHRTSSIASHSNPNSKYRYTRCEDYEACE